MTEQYEMVRDKGGEFFYHHGIDPGHSKNWAGLPEWYREQFRQEFENFLVKFKDSNGNRLIAILDPDQSLPAVVDDFHWSEPEIVEGYIKKAKFRRVINE